MAKNTSIKTSKVKSDIAAIAEKYPKYRIAADFFEAIEEVLSRYNIDPVGLSITVINNEIRVSYYVDDKVEEIVSHIDYSLPFSR